MVPDENGAPMLDASARTLGARAMIDVPGDAADIVEPGSGGMSASSGGPEHLPEHRRPNAFGGTGADPVFAADIGNLGKRPGLATRSRRTFGPWLCRTCA